MRRVLDDGVVRLREADEDDVPSLERGLRDPEVARRFGRVDATAAEVLELNRGRWRDLSGPTFAITTPDLGFAGLVWINRRADPPTDRGAVGYWLLPEARRRGLAARAVALICDWAFADLRLAAVDLLTEADNAASRAVAEVRAPVHGRAPARHPVRRADGRVPRPRACGGVDSSGLRSSSG